MNTRQVALLARRFWPLVGEAEMAAADLAIALRQTGHQPTVVTARWQKNWPQEFVYEDVPVVRIAHPSWRGWGDWRYVRGVTRWLRRHRQKTDVAVAAGLQYDAAAAVNALEHSAAPVVLLAEGRDLNQHRAARWGRLIHRRCQRADAVVAPDRETCDALAEAGFAAQRLYAIAPGVPIPPPTSGEARRDARRALTRAWDGPQLSPLAPLAVCVGPLETGRGLVELFAAWQRIAAQWPQAQLWLLGEGAGRAALYDRIEQLNLAGRILMPGAIESLDDVLAAADLFLLPDEGCGAQRYLQMAMAAGLPIVASDTPLHRPLVTSHETGLLFEPGDAQQATAAIERLLKLPSLAAALGAAGRKRAIEQFSIRRQVDELGQLFEQLIAAKSQHR